MSDERLRWTLGSPPPSGVTKALVSTLASRPGPVIEVGASVVHLCRHKVAKHRGTYTEADAQEAFLASGGHRPGVRHMWPCTCCENLYVTASDEQGTCPACTRRPV